VIRYSPRPLPATAYVPGSSPRADRPAESPPRTAVDVDDLAGHDDFRFGVDLFNHGFPWEAHEAWEPLWFAASRERPERALLHGLIHAAAAVVKAKAGAFPTARDFIESACEHLALASISILDVPSLIAALQTWAVDPARPAPTIVLR